MLLAGRAAERLSVKRADFALILDSYDDWQVATNELMEHFQSSQGEDKQAAMVNGYLETVNTAVAVLLAQPALRQAVDRLAEEQLAHQRLSGKAARAIITASLRQE